MGLGEVLTIWRSFGNLAWGAFVAIATDGRRRPALGKLTERIRETGAACGVWLSDAYVADSDRLFLWIPVFLGIGVALYFGLPAEPPLWLALMPVMPAAWALWRTRHSSIFAPFSAAVLCVVIGFAATTYRSHVVAAPVLERPMAGNLSAKVLSVETTETGALSAILAPSAFGRLSPADLPARVKVNIRLRDATLRPGAEVNLRARLMPPPEPVLPYGFDFARQSWFSSLGAVGFAYTAPEETVPPTGMGESLTILRMSIGDRIRSKIGGTGGAVAAALITGERASIPDPVSVDLRAAGIYHVLSISGLHMVLFAGSLFWAVRMCLVLVPGLALRYPIKKWAAAVAILGATFYLVISGAAVATQRAWIMICLMFLAVLLDRPALSMRNVMLAATVILLWRPESLIGASFQMSFSAVVALIAFYESEPVRRWTSRPRAAGVEALISRAFAYILGIALTSIVAGTATGVIAAFHFNRIAIYGLAGNMAAMPLVGIVVMPMALVSLLLMPLGLDGPALWAMGKGVDGMLAIAHEVAAWNGADRMVPAAPLSALVITVLGALWLTLWRASWRYAGILPIVVGLGLWGSGPKPDILVDRDAALFAVRGADGHLVFTASRPSYTAGQWLRYEGDARTAREAARSDFMKCDGRGCAYSERERPSVAFPETLGAVVEDCERSEIVIAAVSVPRQIRKECAARLLLDYFFFWRNGATAITLGEGGQLQTVTAKQVRGVRPWVQRSLKNQ
ncbi:ComEC/Rec2 family competence protein [Parvibaculum sp.]|uniref:ComEC/Rec2 family competence protein n=1 Tax=Parvibaculum sp. TaxID=2024848 RepID=UPI003297CD04